MCGIAGVIGGLAGDSGLVGAMLARIRHRGPDGEGTVMLPRVALAHARLSIIDLSEAASQPMRDPENGNVIVFNGEIYNYRELARNLNEPRAPRSGGDTATLLRAYAQWGEGCLSKLRGMFAFAIYDARRGGVLLARDRFGMKPLYYREMPGTVLFASEIKALLSSAHPHSANLQKLGAFLAFRHLDADEQTCFNEVSQVPPAHYMWIESCGALSRRQCYWRPPNFGRRLFTEADSESVAEALAESVRLHVRADVPLGAFVSGGVDSSSVACLADRELGHGSLSTYSSVLVDSWQNSENRLIPGVLEHLGAAAHRLVIDGKTFVEDLPRVFDHHEEPLADASMYAHWRLSELARQTGLRVLLSGNGGDEVFGGYHAYIYACVGSLIATGQLLGAVRAINAFSARGWGGRGNLAARGIHEALPSRARSWIKSRAAATALRHTAFLPVVSDLRFYYEAVVDRLIASFRNHLQHWTVPPFLHYEDRNGMAFGVEVRTPMLDHVLLEAVWSFDPRSLIAGRPKQALRDAMRGVVPDAVLDQPAKFGFAAPLEFYMEVDSERFDDCYHDLVRCCPYFDTTHAGNALAEFRNGNASQAHMLQVWRTFSIALWYDRFMTGRWQ